MKKLDPNLLGKMAAKTGKTKQYLREQISRRASRSAISSLAAQLLWAKDLGLGIAIALNHADTWIREEVRSHRAPAPTPMKIPIKRVARTPLGKKPSVSAAVTLLIEDRELRDRCRDLLLAKRHYDRVVREATTVLDARLKNLTGIPHMNPVALVGKALSPDPDKAIIVISSEKDMQQGFHGICNGVMLAFRNRAHHSLSNAFTQAEALKFCAFVDALLAVIGKAELHLERV